jgi:hypothetical protein
MFAKVFTAAMPAILVGMRINLTRMVLAGAPEMVKPQGGLVMAS